MVIPIFFFLPPRPHSWDRLQQAPSDPDSRSKEGVEDWWSFQFFSPLKTRYDYIVISSHVNCISTAEFTLRILVS